MASTSALRALRCSHIARTISRNESRHVCFRRSLHQTPVALKKKSKHGSSSDEDSLFAFEDGENLISGDLFGGESVKTPKQKTEDAKHGFDTFTTASGRGKLTPEERRSRFNALYSFVSQRVGSQPVLKTPEPRKSAWIHLFGLAATKEQMEQLVELLPQWRAAGRGFSPRIAEAFVYRCEQLQCPLLALQVFSNRQQYGLDLSTLTAARQLLHSLHLAHSLPDIITLTALFKVYNLPPISTDLISCAMLTSACFKHSTPESLTIARAMVPHLKKLVEDSDPKEMVLPEDRIERAKVKERAWVAWTLTKIEKALKNDEASGPADWLMKWREESGHAQLAT